MVDFSIESEDADLTKHYLNQDNLIVVISYSLEKIEADGALKLRALQDEARANNYEIIGLTASGEGAKNRINEAYNIDFEWYLCDEKALKTVVRANPGILELDSGTIKQKVHWSDIEDLQLPKVEPKISFPKKLQNENIAYFIDGEASTKKLVEALNSDRIESVNVIKDSVQLKELNTQNNTLYLGIVEVKLKKDSLVSNN